MANENIVQLSLTENGPQVYPQTHIQAVIDNQNVTLETTLAQHSAAISSVNKGEYVVSWDGDSTPTIADIPAGVVVTYNSTDYTGTLSASSDTMNKVYLVADGNGNAARYVVSKSGNTYSWVSFGSTEIDMTNYTTITEFNQLSQKVTDLGNGLVVASQTPTQVGHLNIDGSADKFSHSASGSVYVYYVPISKGQHILYKATNASAQTFRYAFSQSVPAQDVLATGVYRGSESSVNIDVESPVNGYFAVYHGGGSFTDQTFSVGTPTSILTKINTISEGTKKADAFVADSTQDKASSFASGFYNMNGKSVGDNIQTSMNTSDDLETAVVDIKPGQVLQSNTSLVTSSSVAHAIITDSWKIVAFPTTQRINDGLVLTNEEISAGATKVIVVYRISTQFFEISLSLSNNYKSIDGRIANLETDIVKVNTFMEGSVESNGSAWESGYYNMNSKAVGGKKASNKTSSTDLATAIIPISEGVIVQSNTMLVVSSAVKHAILTDDDTIVSFPTTQRINEGLSLTDAEVLAGGSRLLVVYRISIQDVGITLTSSYGFAYIKKNLQSGGLMKGKTVILCGDSQLGQAQGVDEMIQEIVGGKVLNCGFGGCRMSWRTNDGSDPYDAFTMINVADCLVSGDFSTMLAQTEVISSYPYFADAIANLQSVSMADGKDIVLTIAYGGNDFAGGATIGSLDTESKTTYLGALAYCVRVLLTAYPRLSILLVGLPYRVYEYETDPETGEKTITSDSDTYVKTSGLHRYDFNDALLDAGKILKLPAFDMYRRSGRNKFNVFALCPDGTHPTTIAGKRAEAELYAKILQSF